MKNKLLASCHCGNVQIEALKLPATFTECNCSICRRYGAMWAYYRRDEIKLESASSALSAYSWGDRCIEFYHCKNCGCLTHYESAEKGDDSRVAINARMFPAAEITEVPCRQFDGADSWSYLD